MNTCDDFLCGLGVPTTYKICHTPYKITLAVPHSLHRHTSVLMRSYFNCSIVCMCFQLSVGSSMLMRDIFFETANVCCVLY